MTKKKHYIKKKKAKEKELKKRYNSFLYRENKTNKIITKKPKKDELLIVECLNNRYELTLSESNKSTQSLKEFPYNSFHRDGQVWTTYFTYRVESSVREFYFYSYFYFNDYEELTFDELKMKYKLDDNYIVGYYPYFHWHYYKEVKLCEVFDFIESKKESKKLTKKQRRIKKEKELEHNPYKKMRLESRNRASLNNDLKVIKNNYNKLLNDEYTEKDLLYSYNKLLVKPYYCSCEWCLETSGEEVVIDEEWNVNGELIDLMDNTDYLTSKVHSDYEKWDWDW